MTVINSRQDLIDYINSVSITEDDRVFLLTQFNKLQAVMSDKKAATVLVRIVDAVPAMIEPEVDRIVAKY